MLLGAASVWPPIYLLIFMGIAFYSVIAGGNDPAAVWMLVVPFHLLTILLVIGLMIFYIVDVFRNERVNKDMKVLWAVVLFMGTMIAMPVYWYLYIWREPADPPHSPRLGPLTSSFSNQPDAASTSGRTVEYVPPSQPPDWR